MSTIRASRLDNALERLGRAMPARPPGAFPPLTVILAQQASWGIGVRGDTALPFAGTVKLIHWIVSPYSGVPDGIVEDCGSCRLPIVGGTCDASLTFRLTDQEQVLPQDRAHRRNLLIGRKLLGLRGWDIPHDRHASVTDLCSGKADTSGADLPDRWHLSWSLDVCVWQREFSIFAVQGKSTIII